MADVSFKGRLDSEPVLERTTEVVQINARVPQQVIDQRPI